MKGKLALTAGTVIVLLLLVGAGWYKFNQPHRNVGNAKADISITAVELFKQFQQNEAVANSKYINKIIEVSGTVLDVQSNGKSIIIILNALEQTGAVNCMFTNDEKTKSLLSAKGKSVTVKGKCTGFLMDVDLVDCVLVPPGK